MTKYRIAFTDIVENGMTTEYFNQQAHNNAEKSTMLVVAELIDKYDELMTILDHNFGDATPEQCDKIYLKNYWKIKRLFDENTSSCESEK